MTTLLERPGTTADPLLAPMPLRPLGRLSWSATSLARLRTDRVDLMFVHSLDSEEQFHRILGPDSVLKAIEECRAAGQIRYVGVSGHWVKHLMARIIQEYPFDAVLFPAGFFNLA